MTESDYRTVKIALRIVPVEALRKVTQAILRTTDLPSADADIISDALITSELRNLQGQGQGVRRVRAYVDRVRNRDLNSSARFEVLKESPSLALVDGHNGAGTVIAVKAMRLAIEKAKHCGVGTVLVRNSTHFGSASYSASQALDSNCIGLCFTNAGPEMAPWGGIDGVVGTNPWAIAVPTGPSVTSMPIILDMALTTAGKGMMGWLIRDGKRMPTDWAITRDGQVTDDPALAMDGTLLPMGEYKGYGLSLMTDVLSGVLGGGGYGVVPYSDQASQNVAHQFIAYDIGWFLECAKFYRSMEDFIRMIKSSRTRPGVKEILLPGELEWRRHQQKLLTGVPLDPEIYDDLCRLAREVGVDWPHELS